MDTYEAGIEALERNAFAEAFRLLSEADTVGGLSAGGLRDLADAAYWSGHPDESIEAQERAYSKSVADDDLGTAGLVALSLAREYMDRNDSALGGAWFSRAEKLLADRSETRELGYLEMMRAFIAHFSGDEKAALKHGEEAERLGALHRDANLQGMSLIPQALAHIHTGDVSKGLALMDEATVAAVSGDLKPEFTGAIYCSTIGICRDLADYRRAAEWTDAAERWCKRTSIAGFPGICRVHRAEILTLRGSWLEAEQEAVKAADELARYASPELIAESFKEIGMIRLRMGDLAGAGDAFSHAHELYRAPQPGLSLLKLAEGKADAAMASITAALEEETWNRLARARLLPAMVEIARARGDLEHAITAAKELGQIASDFGSTALTAAAATARATVDHMQGRFDEAIRSAKEARAHWLEVGAPYEAAMARVLLGEAMLDSGQKDLGELELTAAVSNLQKLGALLDARDAARRIEGLKTATPKMTVKTFMFTDIVRSTDLVQVLGDEAWPTSSGGTMPRFERSSRSTAARRSNRSVTGSSSHSTIR